VSLQDVVNAINTVSGFSASIQQGDGVSALPNGIITTAGLSYLKVVSTTGQAITAANGPDNAGPSVLTALGLPAGSSPIVTGGDAADVASYAAVIAQINATAADSNYQGNNLINGAGHDLTVQVNELSTTPITVSSVSSTQTGLSLEASVTWGTSAEINTTIGKINNALSTLQTQASGFANSLSLLQTRQDFTTNLVNTLQDGASQLTIADKNEEGANLLALQTQQQLGIEALSLSSQANQSVLRLFA
jgi:flagellin-like hook-associated protein FlgL